jgi:hypothetical protein
LGIKGITAPQDKNIDKFNDFQLEVVLATTTLFKKEGM